MCAQLPTRVSDSHLSAPANDCVSQVYLWLIMASLSHHWLILFIDFLRRTTRGCRRQQPRTNQRLTQMLISVSGFVSPLSVPLLRRSIFLFVTAEWTHFCSLTSRPAGTFSYRINSRLFPVPLHSEENCPVCKTHKSAHPHTPAEPALIR